MGENLIMSPHILVVTGSLVLREATVEMLDVTRYPCHLNTSFNSKVASSFHLPSRPGTPPRSHFSESGDDNNLVQVYHALCLPNTCKLQGLGSRDGSLREVPPNHW